MCSEDRGPRIGTPQGQLLLYMLYFAGIDVCLDTEWDRDTLRGAFIDVFFSVFILGGGHRRTHR
jgi:hypothetical protein